MNGWDRVPDTFRAHVQVENYLASLRAPTHSFATVLRICRQIEVLGLWEEPNGVTNVREYHRALDRFGGSDLANLILNELRRRGRVRNDRSPGREATHTLLTDGSLRPITRPDRPRPLGPSYLVRG